MFRHVATMNESQARQQAIRDLSTAWLVALAVFLGCAAPLVAGQTQWRGK